MKQIRDELPFDYYQLHFDPQKDLEMVSDWIQIVGREQLWLAPKIAPDQSFPKELSDGAETFVIDSYKKDQYGGTGTTGSWDRFDEFAKLDESKQWILAGGLNPENVQTAIKQTGTKFIDVNSGVEIEAGVKSEDKICSLFKQLG